MTAAQPIPRISLGWLLLAQTLVILPFWLHVPLWMIVPWLGCTLWRIQIFRMRAPYPRRWLKLLLVVATAVGVFFSRGY